MTRQTEGKRRIRIRRPSLGTILGSLALIVALGGVAHSAVPSPGGKIHACYLIDPDPDFSYVYIVDHDANCQSGEERVSWDQTGADQGKVATAEDGALKIDFAQLNGTLADANALFKRLGTPKVSGIPKSTFKPFKKKEGKGLNKAFNRLKKNDREISREIKRMREVMSKYRSMDDLLKGIQVDQKAVVLQAIRAMKVSLP